MDGDNSLNMRNWGYYEPTTSLKGHLGLQLMSSIPEKPLIGGRNAAVMAGGNNGAFHHRDIGVSHSTFPMDYMRDAWINQREKFINVLPTPSPNYSVLPETSSAHHMQMVQQPPDLSNDERIISTEETVVEKENGPIKKRQGAKPPKSPKEKKAKRAPRATKAESSPSAPRARSAAKKTTEIVINGIDMDISGIPIPVCSCTGTPQQCYRWGSGGWQSACCTTNMSIYPLPMSTKRRGARIAGRKMSIGAFKKVLEKLAAEGYDFSNQIDLRTHWAKHGTNKFVTIR
ncbi:protein BASIC PENTACYSTEINE2-like [Quercus lobata]|uniref:GAGA-binding transcriptional activator n=1 Tax=Quercus lobata TaxID=97700 RepID=A0A7N2MTK6_QUELO|nr:protein BASIC PENTACYSTEINE2-like [Quercus lobata]XP_030939396.1 protein BASIC PENTACYSTEINE2-like [Quercus lobata]